MRKAGSFIQGSIAIIAMIAMWVVGIALVVFVGKHLEAIYGWSLDIVEWAVAVCTFVVAPLSLFRKTRLVSATGYVIASYVFGANLFLFGVLVVLSTWGVVALIIGLVFAGVGVVPVALLASILHREWNAFWQLVLGLVFTWGTRAYGLHLGMKADREQAEAVFDAATSEIVVKERPEDGSPF